MPDPISATTPTLQTTAKESRHDTFKSWEIKPHTQYDHVTDEKKNNNTHSMIMSQMRRKIKTK